MQEASDTPRECARARERARQGTEARRASCRVATAGRTSRENLLGAAHET